MKKQWQLDGVKIVMFQDTAVAALTHRRDPRLIGDSIRKFIEWRKQNRLPPRLSAPFNVLYDDPDEACDVSARDIGRWRTLDVFAQR